MSLKFFMTVEYFGMKLNLTNGCDIFLDTKTSYHDNKNEQPTSRKMTVN